MPSDLLTKRNEGKDREKDAKMLYRFLNLCVFKPVQPNCIESKRFVALTSGQLVGMPLELDCLQRHMG